MILAWAEESAADLSQQPERLAEMVQKGLLFTAPNQASVAIEEVRNGLAKVRIVVSGSEERVGWVPRDQIAPAR